MPGVHYGYPDGDHTRWKVAAAWKGQSLKDWIQAALNQVADEQLATRAEEERRRRSR